MHVSKKGIGVSYKTYLFITNSNGPILLMVFGTELIGQCSKQDARLDKIVKLDISGSTTVKHANHKITELRRPEDSFKRQKYIDSAFSRNRHPLPSNLFFCDVKGSNSSFTELMHWHRTWWVWMGLLDQSQILIVPTPSILWLTPPLVLVMVGQEIILKLLFHHA